MAYQCDFHGLFQTEKLLYFMIGKEELARINRRSSMSYIQTPKNKVKYCNALFIVTSNTTNATKKKGGGKLILAAKQRNCIPACGHLLSQIFKHRYMFGVSRFIHIHLTAPHSCNFSNQFAQCYFAQAHGISRHPSHILDRTAEDIASVMMVAHVYMAKHLCIPHALLACRFQHE